MKTFGVMQWHRYEVDEGYMGPLSSCVTSCCIDLILIKIKSKFVVKPCSHVTGSFHTKCRNVCFKLYSIYRALHTNYLFTARLSYGPL